MDQSHMKFIFISLIYMYLSFDVYLFETLKNKYCIFHTSFNRGTATQDRINQLTTVRQILLYNYQKVCCL
jgi:hypothetical protein